MLISILVLTMILSLGVFLIPLRYKQLYSLMLVGVGAGLSLYVALSTLLFDQDLIYSGGGNLIFGSSLFVVDNISAIFMLMISIAAIAVMIYSKGYLAKYHETKASSHFSIHYMSLVLLCFSMMIVVMARDSLSFLMSWELMTISSFLLILFEAEKPEVRRAALSYLILMHVGFVFLLVGFTMISAQGLPPTLDSLTTYFVFNEPLPIFLIFLVGFGMKAGIFPLHFWLPEAHPAAPAHVSAFMSGVMIKMGIYGVIRVLSYMDSGLHTVGVIIFAIGVVTGVWGAIFAALQNDIKRLLAYSSIENVGIIFLAIGLAVIGYEAGNEFLAVCAMSGAILHTINHSLFKTLLFFGAGSVYQQTGTTSLDKLGGLAKKMPISASLFMVGVVAISALPPLNGFVSEFLIYYGMFEATDTEHGSVVVAICGIVALALIGGIVIMAFSKLFGIVFLGNPRSGVVKRAKEVDRNMIIGSMVPVVGIVLIGFLPFLLIEGMFAVSSDYFGYLGGVEMFYSKFDNKVWKISMVSVVLLFVIGGLLLFRYRKLRDRKTAVSPVWGCGFTSPNARMQYSGESFSEGLTTGAISGSAEAVSRDEVFPPRRNFRVKRKDRIATLFSQWWIELIRMINKRVIRLNTGLINHYIMYALVFFAVVLVLSMMNLI